MIKPINKNPGLVFAVPAKTVSLPQQKPAAKIIFVEQRKPSLLDQAKQYAKEHPYKASAIAVAGLTTTAAATSLLYIGAKAAWNMDFVRNHGNPFTSPIMRPATLAERAAAAQSAMGEAVQTVTAPVAAAAATAYAATASAAQSAADLTASAYNAATESVANGCNAAASAVKSAAHSTYNTVTYPFVTGYNAAASAAQSAADVTASAYNATTESVANGCNAAASAVKSAAHSTYNTVTYPFVASYNAAASVAQSASDATASAYNAVTGSVANGCNAVASFAGSAAEKVGSAYNTVSAGTATAARRMYNWLPAVAAPSVDEVFDKIESGAKYVYGTASEAAQVTKKIADNFLFGVRPPKTEADGWFFSAPNPERPGVMKNWLPHYND